MYNVRAFLYEVMSLAFDFVLLVGGVVLTIIGVVASIAALTFIIRELWRLLAIVLAVAYLFLAVDRIDAGRRVWFPAGWYQAEANYPAGYYPGDWYYVCDPPVRVNATFFVPFQVVVPSTTFQPQPAFPLTVPNPVAPVAPAGPPVAAASCTEEVKELKARFALLESQLRGSPAPGGSGSADGSRSPATATPKMGAAKLSGLEVMQKKCASCHGAKVSADKGAGFTLLTEGGTMAELTDKQFLAMYRQLLSGKMPKNDKMEEDEGAALTQYLDTRKAVAK